MARIAPGMARQPAHGERPAAGSLTLALGLSVVVGLLGLAFIAFVLWPRWPGPATVAGAPALPITVSGVLFNVPPGAIRLPLQRRAGPQERLDLAFLWPSLGPPDPTAKPPVSDERQPIDRLFVTIAGANGTLSPTDRVNAIYRRYLADEHFTSPDGLIIVSFRDGTPYQGEDIYVDAAAPERFITRCSRPGAATTPGTCLFERRIEGVDVTVRFPRDWLADWRALGTGIDRLIAQLRPAGN